MVDAPQVRNNEAAHRFEIAVDGATAFADYRLAHGAIVLRHTETPEVFRGRGFASRLAVAALAYAREQGLKVIPLCPFMAAYIKAHPATHDLVHPRWRDRLGIAA